MVDVFIIHSGTNKQYVLDTVVPCLLENINGEKGCHTNALVTSGNPTEDAEYKKKYDNPDSFCALQTGEKWKKRCKKIY